MKVLKKHTYKKTWLTKYDDKTTEPVSVFPTEQLNLMNYSLVILLFLLFSPHTYTPTLLTARMPAVLCLRYTFNIVPDNVLRASALVWCDCQ